MGKHGALNLEKPRPENFFEYLLKNTSSVTVLPDGDISWTEVAREKFQKLYGFDVIALIAEVYNLATDDELDTITLHTDPESLTRLGFVFQTNKYSQYFSVLRNHDVIIHGFYDYFKYFSITKAEMQYDARIYLFDRGYYQPNASKNANLKKPSVLMHAPLRLRGDV